MFSSLQYVISVAQLRWKYCLVFVALTLISVISRATTVAPPEFSQLVNESDYIVQTRVKSVKSEWREKNNHRYILTKVELEVLEVINGVPPKPLVLEMLGGRVGEDEMVIEGMPTFAVNQEDILFIRGNGRQFFPLTAAMHGRYPVVRDKNGRSYVMRNNRIPLHDTMEVVLPMAEAGELEIQRQGNERNTGLSLDSFAQQIRSAVNVNYQGKKVNE